MKRAVLLSIFVAACVDGTPTIQVRQSALQGGQTETGFAAIGVLASGSSHCTATLIGKRSVLTAAHCINTMTLTFTICSNNATCSESTGTSYIGTATKFPGWTGDNTNDLAVVTLQQDVTDATPMPINTTPVAVAQSILVIGYGQPDSGTKRSGANMISVVRGTSFSFANLPNVDDGDSGGPTLVTVDGEALVAGVHSTKGPNGGTDIRSDVFKSWILDITRGDVSLPKVGLPVGGNPLAGPATEGQTCYNRACSAELTCVTLYDSNYSAEKGRYCMEPCQGPGTADPICDGPEACVDSKSAGPVCFAKDNEVQGFTNRDESSGGTATPPSAEPRVPADSQPAENSGGDILPDPQSPIDRGFGATCKTAEDCLSGLCAEQQGYGSFCTAACDPASSACPGAAECFLTTDSATHVCSAPVGDEHASHQLAETGARSSGCNVVGDHASPLWLLVGLLHVRRRRRRL